MEDVCYWGFGVGPGDSKEGLVPAAVGAWFFVAEDEVVEEVWWVGFFVIGCGC